MEHAEVWTRGLVPDGLHPWKISQTVPGQGRPGPNLSSIPLHDPRALILKPRIAPWDEVQAHVYYPCRREIVHNGPTSRGAFRIL